VAIFLLLEWAMKHEKWSSAHGRSWGFGHSAFWGPPSEAQTLYPLMAKENSML
jgi:hypothetical protein